MRRRRRTPSARSARRAPATTSRSRAGRARSRWRPARASRRGRLVEQLDDVLDLDARVALAQAGPQLQQAAGIGGRDDPGAGRERAVELALLELPRLARVGQVVDAGAATAERALLHLA